MQAARCRPHLPQPLLLRVLGGRHAVEAVAQLAEGLLGGQDAAKLVPAQGEEGGEEGGKERGGDRSVGAWLK